MKTYQDDPDEIDEDMFDDYTTHNEPRQKSFHELYGFDERDGPPEEEEDEKRGYEHDPDEPLDELNYRRR